MRYERKTEIAELTRCCVCKYRAIKGRLYFCAIDRSALDCTRQLQFLYAIPRLMLPRLLARARAKNALDANRAASRVCLSVLRNADENFDVDRAYPVQGEERTRWHLEIRLLRRRDVVFINGTWQNCGGRLSQTRATY